MDNIDFDSLFAQRIEYMDFTTDEYVIINRLKNKLAQLGVNVNDINNVLFEFYNFFEIPITLSEIEQVPMVSSYSFLTIPINYIMNDNNDDDSFLPPLILPNEELSISNEELSLPNEELHLPNEELPQINDLQSTSNILNILASMLQNVLPEQSQSTMIFEYTTIQPININRVLEDVVVTTSENSLENLNILKITKEMNENCTICMEIMNEDDEYLDLECKHVFHKNCLETYLKNYNHICPVCRKDIGEPDAQINQQL